MDDRDAIVVNHDADLERSRRHRRPDEHRHVRVVGLERSPVMSNCVQHVVVGDTVLAGAGFDVYQTSVYGPPNRSSTDVDDWMGTVSPMPSASSAGPALLVVPFCSCRATQEVCPPLNEAHIALARATLECCLTMGNPDRTVSGRCPCRGRTPANCLRRGSSIGRDEGQSRVGGA